MTAKLAIPLLAFCSALTICAEECMECVSLVLPPLDGSSAVSVKPAYRWSQGEAETNKVDILIVYDASATAWLASNACGTLEDFARDEVDCLNAGLANTGLDRHFTFRLAGVKAVGADFSAKKISTTLANFIGSVNGKTDEEKAAVAEVQALRDAVAADVVGVLVDLNAKSTYGISYKFLKEDLSSRGLEDLSRHGYCVCDITTLKEKFTLLHELGHTFGAGHDDEQLTDPGPQLMEYSSGYRFEADGALHTTVMGITSSAGKTFIRWPFFSSPLYTFGENGPAVGTAKRNDNTRTLRETYHIIANYRVATPLSESMWPGGSAQDGDALSLWRQTDGDGAVRLTAGSTLETVRYVNETIAVKVSAPTAAAPTVKVKGLPTGMKYTAKTGLITGYPKKKGLYEVTVTAKCKGFETATYRFSISVADVPTSLPGTYIGLSEVDSEPTLFTLSVTAAGGIALKGRIDGKNRSFAAKGLASVRELADGKLSFTVHPSGKIGTSVRAFALDISERRADSSDFLGVLRQIPWGRKDVVAPRIAKVFTVKAGDFQCKIRSSGRALVSGNPGGKRASGIFQLVPEDPANTGDGAVYLLPVSFPEKKTFPGFAAVFRFRISVDGNGRVSGMEWIGG